jgi:hypothetical protein
MHHLVKLIAIDAKWNTTNSSFSLGGSTSVIFACKDPSPGVIDEEDAIGAIGKCERAGFFKTPAMGEVFASCIRAMRADYCGNGLSFTFKGTPIAMYDWDPAGNRRVPEPNPKPVCPKGHCFEASWNGEGASCINHARYENLLRLSGREKLPEKVPVRAVPLGEEKCAVDGLRHCGQTFDPVASCVAQYTDFYFDDNNQIFGPGGFNPIDAVTAQYVCKHNEKRRMGVVRTRTMVDSFPRVQERRRAFRVVTLSDARDPRDGCAARIPKDALWTTITQSIARASLDQRPRPENDVTTEAARHV